MANLVDFVNNELSTKKDFPVFGAGDTITVYYEIKEGEKTVSIAPRWFCC